jgi:3-methyladenine DNA glycosylase AlkD
MKSLGTAQNRKVYARHGVGENMYGLSYANLYALVKQIKTDHALALKLWATGNHDAQVLATMIADPAAMTRSTLKAWAKDLSNPAIADAFVDLVAKTSYHRALADPWSRSSDEWIGRAGWHLIGQLAMHDESLSDAYFQTHLVTIEHNIHAQKNRVKQAMNNALIAIGVRNARLQKRAIAAARKIGKVQIDHGLTNCKTPDAEPYILKTKAHRNRAR